MFFYLHHLLLFYICRSYCRDCLSILVGPGTFDSLTLVDPWICYLCQPHRPHGALIPRADWSIRVQELFANNSAIEFVSDQHFNFTKLRLHPILFQRRHPVFSVVQTVCPGDSTGRVRDGCSVWEDPLLGPLAGHISSSGSPRPALVNVARGSSHRS